MGVSPADPPVTTNAGSAELSPSHLTTLYGERFTGSVLESKQILWQALCRGFFDRYIADTDTVVDLGAGFCEFTNATRGARRIAVDLNPETKRYARDAEVLVTSSEDMSAIPDACVDIVFTSNFFEHLPSKRSLLNTLDECHRILVPGGRLLVLMPNLRYLTGRYWDYFDHHLPLTHLSLAEGVSLANFQVEEVIPRFLPYTVKGTRMRVRSWQVHAYLRLRPVWRVLGRQMFLAARKTA